MLATSARWLVTIALCLAAGAGGPARALTDEELFREFQFNLINPGARALALGGAFVALADDPTAAQSNPGGLFAIPEPAFFVEFRSIDTDPTDFRAETGSLEVEAGTGARDLPFFGVRSVSEPETIDEPTFVSFVWPGQVGGRRLTLAASRSLILSQERTLAPAGDGTEARFAFESFPNTVSGSDVLAYSVAALVSGGGTMEIVHWNASASFEVHPDFAVGSTLTLGQLEVDTDTLTEVVDPLELFVDPAHPRLATQPMSELFRTRIDDTDDDFTFSLGLHWHPDSLFPGGRSPWRLGAVFRKGAEFSVDERTFLNGILDEAFTTTIVVPDRAAVGLSYRTERGLTLLGEVERVEFSDLLDGLRPGVNFLTSERLADRAFATDPDATIRYDVDDGTIPRVGVEYVPGAGRWPWAVRAGYYRMPSSRLELVSFNSADADVNDVFLDAFRGGEDQNHVTAGAGVRLGPSLLQLAGDFWNEGTQVAGSFTLAFGDGAAPGAARMTP